MQGEPGRMGRNQDADAVHRRRAGRYFTRPAHLASYIPGALSKSLRVVATVVGRPVARHANLSGTSGTRLTAPSRAREVPESRSRHARKQALIAVRQASSCERRCSLVPQSPATGQQGSLCACQRRSGLTAYTWARVFRQLKLVYMSVLGQILFVESNRKRRALAEWQDDTRGWRINESAPRKKERKTLASRPGHARAGWSEIGKKGVAAAAAAASLQGKSREQLVSGFGSSLDNREAPAHLRTPSRVMSPGRASADQTLAPREASDIVHRRLRLPRLRHPPLVYMRSLMSVQGQGQTRGLRQVNLARAPTASNAIRPGPHTVLARSVLVSHADDDYYNCFCRSLARSLAGATR